MKSLFALLCCILMVMTLFPPSEATSGSEEVKIWAFPSDSSVFLEWERLDFTTNSTFFADRYEIYRGDSWNNLTYLSMSDGPGYFDHDVVNEQTYHYEITAYQGEQKGISARVIATPRPCPSVLFYSPREVSDCDGFSFDITWTMPETILKIAAFRLYLGHYIVAEFNNTATNAVVDMGEGEWGLHTIRLSVVYEDGKESFSQVMTVYGPMCEGQGISGYLFVGIAVAGWILLVVAVYASYRLWTRKK